MLLYINYEWADPISSNNDVKLQVVFYQGEDTDDELVIYYVDFTPGPCTGSCPAKKEGAFSGFKLNLWLLSVIWISILGN